ncbi:hypothetical protein D3C74_482300 [compost metagenome]
MLCHQHHGNSFLVEYLLTLKLLLRGCTLAFSNYIHSRHAELCWFGEWGSKDLFKQRRSLLSRTNANAELQLL